MKNGAALRRVVVCMLAATSLACLGTHADETRRYKPGEVIQQYYGRTAALESDSPTGAGKVVFEDDGDTGYFYAVAPSRTEYAIFDAMHVYNVSTAKDRRVPVRLEIIWSRSGQQSALRLNGVLHAVFDFAGRRGYCRTGFPGPMPTGWSRTPTHAWDDAALEFFR